MRSTIIFLIFAAGIAASADSGYLPPEACAPCHREIYETYRRTEMGRSFHRITSADPGGPASFYHAASDQHFHINSREGRLYQRRHQVGPDGREINIVETAADFVLGSGSHARTYLHLTPAGQLIELPVAWYQEAGGTWAMNPGYDRADHLDFRRKIDQECFFCHNAYPPADTPPGPELFLHGPISEGIDCQRCHGPGREHVRSAQAGAPPGSIRNAIVNPARLDSARRLEVCLQCHLESTSRRLPYAVRRYGQGFFSYKPGEPLERYILYFDHPQGVGYDDKFEIDGAAYRLMKSACFQKSRGALTCTTCHNPHEERHGAEATRGYVRACLNCHESAHRRSENCLECHMPKRRTDDVVHVLMTDHLIPRTRPTRDLTAPLRETHDTDRNAYRGEVALLYPQNLPATGENELYVAAAQVIDGANLQAGAARLEKSVETFRPANAEFYLVLADAYVKSGRAEKALPSYEEALRRNPDLPAARRGGAQALVQLGRTADAIRMLEGERAPDAATLNALGAAWLASGRPDQAAPALQRATLLDSDLPEVYVNLGAALAGLGNPSQATAALESAIRLRPGLAAAHNDLANILEASGAFERARYYFERAIRLDPEYAVARYNYGRALAVRKFYAEAQTQLTEALRLDPHLAEAAVSLGLAMAATGHLEQAIESYRQALRTKPALIAAHFNLALALLASGDRREARQHFRFILQAEPNDYEARLQFGKILLDDGEYASAIMNLQLASQSPRPEIRSAALRALQAAQSAR